MKNQLGRFVFHLALIFFVLIPQNVSAAVLHPSEITHDSDQASGATKLIVKMRSLPIALKQSSAPGRTGVYSIDSVLEALGTEQIIPLRHGKDEQAKLYRLILSHAVNLADAVSQLTADPNVILAEGDYRAIPFSIPNDPRYAEQWALSKIHMDESWDITSTFSGVTIAVLDSGVDLDHPDLAGSIWSNEKEAPGNSIDDDGNGYIDDVHGWNIVGDNNDIADETGHGSLVAGIITAQTDNEMGIAGICPHCKIMPVKVTQADGTANYAEISAGIDYAVDNGAKIINLSLGGEVDSVILHDAVERAAAKGALIVAGAGNNNAASLVYPAAYPEAVAVAGTNQADEKADFSNYGSWIDISAPAVDILSTVPGEDYAFASGTSMSAPMVSGVLGLIWAQHPDWTASQVLAQIKKTADPVDALNPDYAGQLGTGRLNAYAAVQAAQPDLKLFDAQINTVSGGGLMLGQVNLLTLTLENQWANADGITAVLSTTATGVTPASSSASFGSIAAGQHGNNSTPISLTVDSAVGEGVSIPFRLDISANGGAYSLALDVNLKTQRVVHLPDSLTSDDTLTPDQVYFIDNSLTIPSGVKLTIQPGVVVRLGEKASMNVNGVLVANGSAGQPIQFVPSGTGAWAGLNFNHNPAGDAVIELDGSYKSGDLLRHIRLTGLTDGIHTELVSPYLEYVTLEAGNITGQTGPTPVRIRYSSITQGISMTEVDFFGGKQVILEDVHAASASLPEKSEVNQSVFTGEISLESGSRVTGSQAAAIKFLGDGTAQNSQVGSTISAEGFLVATNNTITCGGIISPRNESAYIIGNVIHSCNGAGISMIGGVVQNNRIENVQKPWPGPWDAAIQLWGGGQVSGNTILDTNVNGILASASIVRGNTLSGVAGYPLFIYTAEGIPSEISNNNFEIPASSAYIYLQPSVDTTIHAENNWWGTTDAEAIRAKQPPQVRFEPFLTAPSSSGGQVAFVKSITPDSDPVGIGTARFTIEFSRDMDKSSIPAAQFHMPEEETWETFQSPFFTSNVVSILIDSHGNRWFGTQNNIVYLTADNVWKQYPETGHVIGFAEDTFGNVWASSDRGLIEFEAASGFENADQYPNCGKTSTPLVMALTAGANGDIWMGTYGEGACVRHSDGDWQVYDPANSGLPYDIVRTLATDPRGNIWFGTERNEVAVNVEHTALSVLHPDGSWETFKPSSSPLPWEYATDLAINPSNGDVWGTVYPAMLYVRHVDGSWNQFSNFASYIFKMDFDRQGNIWLATMRGARVMHPDGSVVVFTQSNSGLPADYMQEVAVDTGRNEAWFGMAGVNGVTRYHFAKHSLTPGEWIDATHYRMSYDFSILDKPGLYLFDAVYNAYSSAGEPLTVFSPIPFIFAYATTINDRSNPPAPDLEGEEHISQGLISVRWSVPASHSPITDYRYAVGTKQNGTDMVSWIDTTRSGFSASGLPLKTGVNYYVTVYARNTSGLWSPPAVLVMKDGKTYQIRDMFLPVIRRAR